MSILSTLSIGAQALQAHQLAIQTTGHNLANVATPGFSRQRVDLVSAYPSFEGGVFLGQGVDVAGVQRVIDRFTEAELMNLHGAVGYSEAESRALGSIQEAFPLSGGVNGALSAFFGALSDLASNPAGSSERVSVVAKARALGENLALTRQTLTSMQKNLDKDIQSAVERVNILTEQIAHLNDQIAFIEVRGGPANDFRDRRQTLLQELTNLTGATVREDANGQVTAVVGGLLLVGGVRFASLSSDSVNANGLHSVTYRSPDGTAFDASALFDAGKIGSLLNVRDNQIQDVIDRLDLFAQTLVDQFNSQHALGFDLNGNAGGNLFNPIAISAGAAANVQVDAALASDPRLIAAAESASALPGDNRNALALVSLRSTTIAALGGLTLEDHFLSLVSDLGSQVQASESRYEFQQALLTQTQARRESVSGVNIDEEMTKLIQYQRAFEASSLLIRSADEMYQALIEMAR
jgi:flagellar hook-associated protein 1 FlgK